MSTREGKTLFCDLWFDYFLNSVICENSAGRIVEILAAVCIFG